MQKEQQFLRLLDENHADIDDVGFRLNLPLHCGDFRAFVLRNCTREQRLRRRWDRDGTTENIRRIRDELNTPGTELYKVFNEPDYCFSLVDEAPLSGASSLLIGRGRRYRRYSRGRRDSRGRSRDRRREDSRRRDSRGRIILDNDQVDDGRARGGRDRQHGMRTTREDEEENESAKQVRGESAVKTNIDFFLFDITSNKDNIMDTTNTHHSACDAVDLYGVSFSTQTTTRVLSSRVSRTLVSMSTQGPAAAARGCRVPAARGWLRRLVSATVSDALRTPSARVDDRGAALLHAGN